MILNLNNWSFGESYHFQLAPKLVEKQLYVVNNKTK